jgi:ribosome-associated toxin RatA of RatAB toxin-antitoxin module
MKYIILFKILGRHWKFWLDIFWGDESSMLFRLEMDFKDRLIQRQINSVSDRCLTTLLTSWLNRDEYKDENY